MLVREKRIYRKYHSSINDIGKRHGNSHPEGNSLYRFCIITPVRFMSPWGHYLDYMECKFYIVF